MASACGIHIDQRRFRLIALDGSAKKHKIVAHVAGEVLPGDDPVAVISAALKAVGKEHNLRGAGIGLAVSSGLAAFRSLTLPFDDRSKIEEVIKYEIESDLPQWDIDDVIVDFLVTDSKPGVQSDLLVTAIPKEHLAPKLAACEKAGLEATEAELDGAALFDVAREAGILDPETAQVLVYVGDSSTTVVVADGTKLTSMRAIRAGAQPVEAPPPPSVGDEAEEPDEIQGEVADAPVAVEPDPGKLLQTIQRIRRELGRTISGAQTSNPIEGVYVCGRELPGFVEEEIFDVPMAILEALPTSMGIPQPAEMMVAYGAALHQLGGGGLRSSLRREDLRFTGKFERLELPLAVFALLLVTLLAVKFIVVDRQIKWRERDLHTWLEASNTFMLPTSSRPHADQSVPWVGRVKEPSETLVNYAVQQAELGGDEDRTEYEQIDEIRKILLREIDAKEKELGQKRDFEQPLSALQGLTLVMCAIDDLGEQVGRIGLRSLTADYRPGRGRSPEEVVVKLDIDFLGSDNLAVTNHFTTLSAAISSAPWCIEFEDKSTKPIDGNLGISVDGMTIHIDPRLAPEE